MELTFSPQIHQKYIYIGNDSPRTSTEHWQKTSGFQKGKEISMQLGRVKEKKERERERNWDGTCASGREM